MKYKDILRFVDLFGNVYFIVGGHAYDTMRDARAAVARWKHQTKGGPRG